MSKVLIGNLNHYIPNNKEKFNANEKIKEIVENNYNISNVTCYDDNLYGEHRFIGYDNDSKKEIIIIWNYFNGNIYKR